MGKSAKQEHIEHYKHNEAFLEVVMKASPDAYFDWKITVNFYSALHLVRAFLVSKGVEHVDSHHNTLNCISPQPSEKPPVHLPLPKLYRPYSHLYLLSRNARYDGFLHAKEFEKNQRSKLNEAAQCVEKIKAALAEEGFKIKPAKQKKSPVPTPEAPRA